MQVFPMITYRLLDISEVDKIAQIDRSEQVTSSYRYQNGSLEQIPVDWQIPRWESSGEGGHSVAVRVKSIRELLRCGGAMIGAFDGDGLIGFAVVRYSLREDMAQLDALFVSRAYRRQGIAERLLADSEQLALQDGAQRMYVTATPTESAVGFYRSQGFVPTAKPLPELFELEPDDIHMIKPLIQER
jgi:GNAT superfamily N-acetyltransferase